VLGAGVHLSSVETLLWLRLPTRHLCLCRAAAR